MKQEESFSSTKYLVANVPGANSEIHAPEINFYLRNTEEPQETRLEKAAKICDLRAAIFDHGQDMEMTVMVGKRLALITQNVDPLREILVDLGYHVVPIIAGQLLTIDGHIGNFSLQVNGRKENRESVQVDQIVWPDAPAAEGRRRGIHPFQKKETDQLLADLAANLGSLKLKKVVRYDRNICLHDGKRHDLCALCLASCPSSAITKTAGTGKLAFSPVDCTGCGICIAVCPTGALEYTPLPPARSFITTVSHYRDQVCLVLSETTAYDSLHLSIPAEVLPFVVPSLGFLHEGYLLDMIRTTGRPVILYIDDFPPVLDNIIRLLNEFFVRTGKPKAIYRCSTLEELRLAFADLTTALLPSAAAPLKSCQKRKDIAEHLAWLIGDGEYGTIETGPHIHFGQVSISKDACTLCLSCADACPMDALKPYPGDNTLRFNPSLCVGCGYCEKTCPEHACLKLTPDRLALSPASFTYTIMARDEIFRCIVCGAEIGPAKSIAKIGKIMAPLFEGDETKLKTLSCCPDCKAKTMIESAIMHNDLKG